MTNESEGSTSGATSSRPTRTPTHASVDAKNGEEIGSCDGRKDRRLREADVIRRRPPLVLQSLARYLGELNRVVCLEIQHQSQRAKSSF